MNQAAIADGPSRWHFQRWRTMSTETCVLSVIASRWTYFVRSLRRWKKSLVCAQAPASINPSRSKIKTGTVYRHFAQDNDDGVRTLAYKELISSTLLTKRQRSELRLLAIQFRLYATNCPLTEGDFNDVTLPKVARASQRQAAWAF